MKKLLTIALLIACSFCYGQSYTIGDGFNPNISVDDSTFRMVDNCNGHMITIHNRKMKVRDVLPSPMIITDTLGSYYVMMYYILKLDEDLKDERKQNEEAIEQMDAAIERKDRLLRQCSNKLNECVKTIRQLEAMNKKLLNKIK